MTDPSGTVEVVHGTLPPEGPPDAAPLAAAAAVTVTRDQVLTRAQSWIDERVPYSQSSYHTDQYGTYRQDCSGYVSMCWALTHSYTTSDITDVAHIIDHGRLQPGDAGPRWRAVRPKEYAA